MESEHRRPLSMDMRATETEKAWGGSFQRRTLTKRELVQRIAEKTGVQQINAKEVTQSFLDEIINELAKGNRLEFRDFGVFEPKSKAHRVARNPRTGEKVEVPEKTTVKFKVGRLMKKKIQKDYDPS